MSQISLSPSYESSLLTNFALEYVKHLSYEKVSALLLHRMGNDTLSDQHLFHLVSSYSEQIRCLQASEINDCLSKHYRCQCIPVDIYAKHEKEVIFLSDGVCVSEQKQKRDKVAKQGKERTTTDIMMLQTDLNDKSSYTTIIAAKDINPVDLVQSELLKAYGEKVHFLPIVSISDGARSIKNQNKAIFGNQVIHILDWYHLQQKVIQLMSQIAVNKASKDQYIKLITNYLWTGNVISAVLVLKFMETKNKTKTDELVGYLEKNSDHIINYELRKSVGKIIGSGRTEKQNDCIVSRRQKRKGMSWSKQGSRDLAILTNYHEMAA